MRESNITILKIRFEIRKRKPPDSGKIFKKDEYHNRKTGGFNMQFIYCSELLSVETSSVESEEASVVSASVLR